MSKALESLVEKHPDLIGKTFCYGPDQTGNEKCLLMAKGQILDVNRAKLFSSFTEWWSECLKTKKSSKAPSPMNCLYTKPNCEGYQLKTMVKQLRHKSVEYFFLASSGESSAAKSTSAPDIKHIQNLFKFVSSSPEKVKLSQSSSLETPKVTNQSSAEKQIEEMEFTVTNLYGNQIKKVEIKMKASKDIAETPQNPGSNKCPSSTLVSAKTNKTKTQENEEASQKITNTSITRASAIASKSTVQGLASTSQKSSMDLPLKGNKTASPSAADKSKFQDSLSNSHKIANKSRSSNAEVSMKVNKTKVKEMKHASPKATNKSPQPTRVSLRANKRKSAKLLESELSSKDSEDIGGDTQEGEHSSAESDESWLPEPAKKAKIEKPVPKELPKKVSLTKPRKIANPKTTRSENMVRLPNNESVKKLYNPVLPLQLSSDTLKTQKEIIEKINELKDELYTGPAWMYANETKKIQDDKKMLSDIVTMQPQLLGKVMYFSLTEGSEDYGCQLLSRGLIDCDSNKVYLSVHDWWKNCLKARYLGNEDPNVADMDDKISAYGNLFTLQNRQGYQLGRMARILYAGKDQIRSVNHFFNSAVSHIQQTQDQLQGLNIDPALLGLRGVDVPAPSSAVNMWQHRLKYMFPHWQSSQVFNTFYVFYFSPADPTCAEKKLVISGNGTWKIFIKHDEVTDRSILGQLKKQITSEDSFIKIMNLLDESRKCPGYSVAGDAFKKYIETRLDLDNKVYHDNIPVATIINNTVWSPKCQIMISGNRAGCTNCRELCGAIKNANKKMMLRPGKSLNNLPSSGTLHNCYTRLQLYKKVTELVSENSRLKTKIKKMAKQSSNKHESAIYIVGDGLDLNTLVQNGNGQDNDEDDVDTMETSRSMDSEAKQAVSRILL